MSFKASPQTINYLIISLMFTPRLFSELIYKTGTVLTLIFWIVPLVMIAEMANEKWTEKIKITKLPKLSSYTWGFTIFIISLSFYWRELIFADSVNSYQNLKRSFYLVNPIILFSWYPFIQASNKKYFLKVSIFLTLGLFTFLTIPKVFEVTFIEPILNNTTASISALILSVFFAKETRTENFLLFIDTYIIEVGGGCSSTPQIMISLFASVALYICCKIKSKKSLIFYVIIVITIAFLLNSLRISILGYLISIENTKAFDFWHDGVGSLIFSFLIMLLSCSIYYYLWTRENPIEIKKDEGQKRN